MRVEALVGDRTIADAGCPRLESTVVVSGGSMPQIADYCAVSYTLQIVPGDLRPWIGVIVITISRTTSYSTCWWYDV